MSFLWSPERSAPPLPADLPMQQHPLYGRASAASGAEVERFALGSFGSAQVIYRRWPLLGRFALITRGPIWHGDVPADMRREGLHALVDALARENPGVIVTPDLCDGRDPLLGSGLLQNLTPFHTAVLDLIPPTQQRRAALHGKWRNRLVRAEAAGLRVVHSPLPATPHHWLLRAEERQSRAKRYANLPTEFTTAWANCSTKTTRLFEAQKDGKTVAAMLFLLHAPTASYHIGWSGTAGRACSAHNLLLWQASCWLARKGITQIDLGALDTAGAPGLARFKLGAGGQMRSTGSTWMRAPLSRAVARLFPVRS